MANTFLIALLIGCSIHAAQQQTLRSLAEKHQKYIGVALSPDHLLEKEYADILDREIDCITPENAMKWVSVQRVRDDPNYQEADILVKHAQAHGMRIRGHTLLWHQALPSWVEHANWTEPELKKVVQEHITAVMTRYKGKLYAWDVVNEVIKDGEHGGLRETIFLKTLGKDYIADAFRFAHSVDPDVKLYINDYSIEWSNAKTDALLELLAEFKNASVPIHGVGLQAHSNVDWPHKQDIKRVMEEFVKLGLEVALTEMDMGIPLPATPESLEKQSKAYENLVGACVEVPKCVGVTFWGLSDKHSWIPGATHNKAGAALPWDEHFKEKPAYTGIKNALSQQV